MNKKGEIVSWIILVLLVLVLVYVVFWTNTAECTKNKDCADNQYCGSDYECHDYPNVEKNVYEINLLLPALILAVAIVAAAFIFRKYPTRK